MKKYMKCLEFLDEVWVFKNMTNKRPLYDQLHE